MEPYRFKTISEYHNFRGLPKPHHPLISVIDVENITVFNEEEPENLITDFYIVALKRNVNAKMKYGQQTYDFDEGIMMFLAPNQVFAVEASAPLQHTGYVLLIHPDFLWQTPLAKNIKQYEYFNYSVNEALYLSSKEEEMILQILKNIEIEYNSNIDKFSQNLIIAQLEVFFTFADRFYHRQFLTRKIVNHQILNRLEMLLFEYFNNDDLADKGLPTVQFVANTLNVSPNYLSGVLKVLTGQSTQQHIHNKLIDKAKEKLSTTELSISEIAYELGFEHSQSFSKLFKTKTNQSPLQFRQSFN